MNRLPLLLAAMLPASGLANPCAMPTTTMDLAASIDEAENAFATLDFEAFILSTDNMRMALPCLSEELGRHEAAEVHRVQGMRAFIDQDVPTSEQAFAAARMAEPRYRFPTTLVAPGTPIASAYSAVDVSSGTYDDLQPPSLGRLQLDGMLTLKRPTAWPTLVQFFDAEGGVSQTLYLKADQALPEYEVLAEGDEGQWTYDVPEPSPRKPLLAGAGASAVAGAVLYGMALSTRARWDDDATSIDDLDDLRSRANTLGAAGVGLGVVAVGLGTSGMLVGGGR